MLTPSRKQQILSIVPMYRALYLNQLVYQFNVSPLQKLASVAAEDLEKMGWHLSLRSVKDLTEEEIKRIADYLQVCPEDLLAWINGEACHEDFNSMWAWLPCIDFLRSIGIALPYYSITTGLITVDEWVEVGAVQIRM